MRLNSLSVESEVPMETKEYLSFALESMKEAIGVDPYSEYELSSYFPDDGPNFCGEVDGIALINILATGTADTLHEMRTCYGITNESLREAFELANSICEIDPDFEYVLNLDQFIEDGDHRSVVVDGNTLLKLKAIKCCQLLNEELEPM